MRQIFSPYRLGVMAIKASQIVTVAAAANDYLAGIGRVVTPWHGLDVTDYGLGNFDTVGLVAYVLDNRRREGYAHKRLVLARNQICPNHYHWTKSETICCEDGQILITLGGQAVRHGAGWDERCRLVDVEVNNVPVHHDHGQIEMGTVAITLNAGDAIFLPHGTWHEFRAVGGFALAEEVSTFNDDDTDNVFSCPDILRFPPEIDQDVPGTTVGRDDLGFIIMTEV